MVVTLILGLRLRIAAAGPLTVLHQKLSGGKAVLLQYVCSHNLFQISHAESLPLSRINQNFCTVQCKISYTTSVILTSFSLYYEFSRILQTLLLSALSCSSRGLHILPASARKVNGFWNFFKSGQVTKTWRYITYYYNLLKSK